eukprot:8850421-Pyramimonas_sp.AAC.1
MASRVPLRLFRGPRDAPQRAPRLFPGRASKVALHARLSVRCFLSVCVRFCGWGAGARALLGRPWNYPALSGYPWPPLLRPRASPLPLQENGVTVVAVRKPTEIDREDVLKDTQRFKSGVRGVQKNMAESMLRRPMAKLLPSSSGKKGAAKFIDSGDDDGSASDGLSIHSGTDGEAELVEPGRCDGGRAAASHKGSKA